MLSLRGVTAGHRRGEPVLDGLDLDVPRGGTVGLVGPSGSGKTTAARVAALLLAPWAGEVLLDGEPARGVRYAVPASRRRRVALVFQSPRRSVDPRHSLARIVAEPLVLLPRRERPSADRVREQVAALAARAGLGPELLDRYPHEVSDGQLQRACIARALAQEPDYLVCDEITSMLDASTAASVVRLLQRESAERGLGVLAISHDRPLLDVWTGGEVRRLDRAAAVAH